MNDSIMLEARNLVKHFPVSGSKNQVVHAVDGVSFQVKKGRTLGLVGESGCGKSSCARTVIRIYEPTAGQIFLDGQEITNLSQRQLAPLRRNIQMVFQDPYASLNARMTVREIINEPLRAHKICSNAREADEMIFEMLDRVGLSREHANRYAHEFSGGQRQRVGIARALILHPKVVICDEPISALDVSIQAQVVNLLKEFQEEEEITYLFIAHDLSMVRYVSDDVGVMYLGKLVELCESNEIYEHPLHPRSQGGPGQDGQLHRGRYSQPHLAPVGLPVPHPVPPCHPPVQPGGAGDGRCGRRASGGLSPVSPVYPWRQQGINQEKQGHALLFGSEGGEEPLSSR